MALSCWLGLNHDKASLSLFHRQYCLGPRRASWPKSCQPKCQGLPGPVTLALSPVPAAPCCSEWCGQPRGAQEGQLHTLQDCTGHGSSTGAPAPFPWDQPLAECCSELSHRSLAFQDKVSFASKPPLAPLLQLASDIQRCKVTSLLSS